MNQQGVCFVVAAYNEGTRVYQAAHQVVDAIQICSTNRVDEVLLIDDGSVDNTQSEMARFQKDFSSQLPIRILSLPMNRGVGNALLAGINSTSRASISLIPGDGVFPSSSIAAIRRFADRGIVLSERRDRYSHHKLRRLLSRLLGVWFSWLVKQRVPDPHSIYILPTHKALAAQMRIWGPWDADEASRLDNRYHIVLLANVLCRDTFTVSVPVSSDPALESNSSVMRFRFIVSFGINCTLLTLKHMRQCQL